MGNDDTTAGRLWSPAFTAGERDCQRHSGYQSDLKADGYKFLWLAAPFFSLPVGGGCYLVCGIGGYRSVVVRVVVVLAVAVWWWLLWLC